VKRRLTSTDAILFEIYASENFLASNVVPLDQWIEFVRYNDNVPEHLAVKNHKNVSHLKQLNL